MSFEYMGWKVDYDSYFKEYNVFDQWGKLWFVGKSRREVTDWINKI